MVIYIGYCLTVLNYIFYCMSRFMKEKRNILILDLFAKIITVISLYCLSSLTGAYSMALGIILLIIANIKERTEDKWSTQVSLVTYIVLQIIYVYIMIITFTGLYSILMTITRTINLASVWWFKPQKMRIVGIFNGLIYIAYQFSIRNWAGILEIVAIISNYFSFKRYNIKKS